MLRPAAIFAILLMSFASHALAAEGDAPKSTAPDEPQDMKQLFNGKDLTGWEGDTRLWKFQDGVIRGETTTENVAKGNTFLLWRGGELKDFELRLSFRIDHDHPGHGNSGVQYRSKQVESKDNNWVVAGYQAEVENAPGKAGFLYHERGRGELCHVGNKVEIGEDGKPQIVGKIGDREAIGKTFKDKDWNDYVIIAKGNHLVHYLNGIQTIDLVDNDPKGRALSGLLALQIHAGPPMVVEFKNVRLKSLEAK